MLVLEPSVRCSDFLDPLVDVAEHRLVADQPFLASVHDEHGSPSFPPGADGGSDLGFRNPGESAERERRTIGPSS